MFGLHSMRPFETAICVNALLCAQIFSGDGIILEFSVRKLSGRSAINS